MPDFLARKTQTHHYLLEADSEEDAQQGAEALPDHDWDESDGPLIEVEVMTETRRCRVQCSFVRHTSMSVGDYLIDETGHLFAVMPVGFKQVRPDTVASRTELALHLLALGLEKTPGWRELFEHDPALLGAAIVERLRTDAHGAARYALAPYQFPTAIELTP